MNERIKPTEDELQLRVTAGIKEAVESIKQQVLVNQEKAEKWDELMSANSGIVQDNISLTKIHQEDKQLKADIEDRDNKIYDLRDVIIDNQKRVEIDADKLKEIKESYLRYSNCFITDTAFSSELGEILKTS